MGILKFSITFVLVCVFGLTAHLISIGIFSTSIPPRKVSRILEMKKMPPQKVPVTIKQIPDKPPSLPQKSTPVKVKVSERLLRRGQKLAGKDATRMGSFPGVSAEFQDTLGWAAYRQAMENLDARFFIYDGVGGQVLCKIAGEKCGPPHPFVGFSPRSRDLSLLPEAKSIIGRLSPGRGKRLILLLPLKMDQIILAVQERAARSKRIRLNKFVRFSGIYQIRNKNLFLKFTGARLRTGKRVSLDVELDLGRVS